MEPSDRRNIALPCSDIDQTIASRSRLNWVTLRCDKAPDPIKLAEEQNQPCSQPKPARQQKLRKFCAFGRARPIVPVLQAQVNASASPVFHPQAMNMML